jgi:hypothetical protein
MAAILTLLGVGAKATALFSAISTIAGPVLGIASAIKGNQEARAQSAEYSRQAREERVTAGIQAARMRRAARAKQSADRTSMAEGGALSGTGLGVLDQNAVAQELDALTVQYQGEQSGRAADFRAKQAKAGSGALNIFSAAIRGFNDMDPLNLAPRGGA